ncbi:hypothetical protein D5086_004642 [Populus alba]|uniref:Uncharacterized protein n=1 Tax=Populus alba TaxID=43335 RepID=A0ACC4CS45_POPAL
MHSATHLEEVKWMVVGLFRNQNQVVDMKKAFLELTLNIIMRKIAGKRYYGDDVSDVEQAQRFRAIHAEMPSLIVVAFRLALGGDMQCHAGASEDSFSLYLDHVLGVC